MPSSGNGQQHMQSTWRATSHATRERTACPCRMDGCVSAQRAFTPRTALPHVRSVSAANPEAHITPGVCTIPVPGRSSSEYEANQTTRLLRLAWSRARLPCAFNPPRSHLSPSCSIALCSQDAPTACVAVICMRHTHAAAAPYRWKSRTSHSVHSTRDGYPSRFHTGPVVRYQPDTTHVLTPFPTTTDPRS
jgi:hypothetical protein